MADDLPFPCLNPVDFLGMSDAGRAMHEEERNRTMETVVQESMSLLAPCSDEGRRAPDLQSARGRAAGAPRIRGLGEGDLVEQTALN